MEKCSFWAFWLLLGALCILGVLAKLVIPPCVYKAWVSMMCLLLDTPFGRRSVGALSLFPLGSLLGTSKTAIQMRYGFYGFYVFMLYMLALVGRPSLHSYDACMVSWVQGASQRNCRQKYGETSFSPRNVFLFSRNPQKRFWGLVFWYLWIGRLRILGLVIPIIYLLRFLLLVVGLLMVILPWMLRLTSWRLLSIV